MTCSKSHVQRRFRPVGSGIAAPNIPLGSRIGLSMLKINCASPAGPPGPVIVQPGNLAIPFWTTEEGRTAPPGERDEINKVEITSAIIAAGREAMSAHWLEFVGPEGFRLWDIVPSETFAAMWEALREPRS